MAETICPVMGTKVNTEESKKKGLVSTYKGKEYYFCCAGCKPAFEADPEKYVEKEK